MSKMQSNVTKAATQVAPTAPSLSKREKAALMTGQKVNLFMKKELVFQLPRKLLEHYSPTWKYQLEQGRQQVLYINNYHKDAIKYITQWMTAGGLDSTVKGAIPYPNDFADLVCLNKLAAELGIHRLQERTLQSIDSYTCRHPLPMMLMQRVVLMRGIPTETRGTIITNLKKWIGSSVDGEWIKEGEQHPEALKGASALVVVVREEVAQDEEARRKVRLSREKRQAIKGKSADAVLATGGKTPAKAPVILGKGPRNGGPSPPQKPKKLANAVKNHNGARAAPTPIDSAIVTNGTVAQSYKAAKASIVCFNCGQADHTRPYCSNPRVFLGKCYTCDQQGHRAAECPSKAEMKPKVKTEVKFEAKAGPKKEGTKKAVPAQDKGMVGQKPRYFNGAKSKGKEAQASFPPMVAKIVFVKDVVHASAVNVSTKGTAHRSTSAQNSSATDASSGSQPSGSSIPTSPETEASSKKLAEQEQLPKVHRFVTKKVRALNITADGSVHREMIPRCEEKKRAS